METISAFLDQSHYAVKIKARNLEIIADEPLELGGTNQGLTPKELLCSALAGCIAITLRMYADRKNWPLESINVEVSLEHDEQTKKPIFNRKISLNGDLPQEQIDRLLQIANLCPVHKILSSSNEINTQLV